MMKKTLVLFITIFCYSIQSNAQTVKNVKPLSEFKGDQKAYLDYNFGMEGYHYNEKSISELLADIEIPIKSIHFEVFHLARNRGVNVEIIRLFFESPEVVDVISRQNEKQIDNITIMMTVFDNAENRKTMEPLLKGRTSDFVIPFTEEVVKIIGPVIINNSYYTKEYPYLH